MAVEVTTNNIPRDLLDYYELTEAERKDFDYLKEEEEYQSYRFFRYKGNVYDSHDCEVSASPQPWLVEWSGYFSETFFSGVVFKFTSDYERVIVGRYFVND